MIVLFFYGTNYYNKQTRKNWFDVNGDEYPEKKKEKKENQCNEESYLFFFCFSAREFGVIDFSYGSKNKIL